jgi:hypothetical integral membrane protein (TIGR02206 family)
MQPTPLPALVTPGAYGAALSLAVMLGVAGCWTGRRNPGRWRLWAARILGVVLLGDAVSYFVTVATSGPFSVQSSLPLPLCDVATVVAAAACLWPAGLLVELTYFWGLAGTLQAVATPDLDVGFPHVVFFQYVVGHFGIVLAALFLVIGMGERPRRGAAPRVLVLTAGYTAVVGLVDWLTGADYMFLSSKPASWSLLSVLGPWPWYTLSATAVAVVLVTALDAPFWPGRRRQASLFGASGSPEVPAPRRLPPSAPRPAH